MRVLRAQPPVRQPVVVCGGDRRGEVGIRLEGGEGPRKQDGVGDTELVDELRPQQAWIGAWGSTILGMTIEPMSEADALTGEKATVSCGVAAAPRQRQTGFFTSAGF